jgi:hypothetical protein
VNSCTLIICVDLDKAPELLDGTTGVYSEKADVYALGMVSFACTILWTLLKEVLRGLDNTGKTLS